MFNRLSLFGAAGLALTVAGYQKVTAPRIELNEPAQEACAVEINDAVNACRSNALAFNQAAHSESPLSEVHRDLRTCLEGQSVSFVTNCSAPDPFFPAHFYLGELPKRE